MWAAASFGLAAISVATKLPKDWVPLDEGAIALSARMAAAGYLPHLDFAYPYSGALALWNGVGALLSGPSLLVPRWQLFAAFLAWLPSVWWLARRYASPPLAAAVVVIASWWSVPVYPAAMPTYYVLFLTTWSLVALARWADGGSRGWVALAGVCAGVAIAIKQTGLYTLVGAGLGVLAMAQARGACATAANPDGTGGTTPRRDPVVGALLIAGLCVPLLIVWRRGLLAGDAAMLALPLAIVLVVLAVRGGAAGAGRAARYETFMAWSLLLAGAGAVLAIFVGFYAVRGGAAALFEGAILGGLDTARTVDRPFPSLALMATLAIPTALLAWAAGLPRSLPMRHLAAAAAALAACGAAARYLYAYRSVWYAAELSAPIAIAAVAWQTRGFVAADGGVALAVAAAAALLSLNSFPFAAPNYFAYSAPLALLAAVAAVALARRSERPHGPFAGPLLRSALPVFLLLAFGGWFHRIGSVYSLEYGAARWDNSHLLTGPGGGLRVSAADSAAYARLDELVAAHGGSNAFAAGPELSALYVLAGTTRLVPQPFLLVPDRHADSTVMARQLDTAAVRAVAINDAPIFLPTIEPGARAWLAVRYPYSERVGDVEFRWR